MCRDTTKEGLLPYLMKVYSMKETMALKVLSKYYVKIIRQQIDFARSRVKGVRADNKGKRVHRKEREQHLLEGKRYRAYKENVCLRFTEAGQVHTLKEYTTIREEFFQRKRGCSLNEYTWK